MEFPHLDKNGNIKMVDISSKSVSERIAEASGFISLNKDTLEKIKNNTIAKGNVLAVAKIAAIMGAKNTQNVIPLCHQINLTSVDADFTVKENGIEVQSRVVCIDKTGAEMEALYSVNVALLTIYDMCKAVDKDMVISEVRLLKKTKKTL